MIADNPKVLKFIKGLDGLFTIVPRDYDFHDAEFESIYWQNGKDIVIKFSDKINERIYFITWNITPSYEEFDFCGAPHNPYVDQIDIKEVASRPDIIRFECEGSGLVVNATAIRVTIEEIQKEDYENYE